MPVEPTVLDTLLQQLIIGLTNGSVFALIALGYTMVYGVIELINFAHGDLFMLGTFLTLTLIGCLDLPNAGAAGTFGGVALVIVICSFFGATLNWSMDRMVYRPLRNSPKLVPLVSAIGISFIFQNLGLFWGGLPDGPSVLSGLVLVLVLTPCAAWGLTASCGPRRKWIPLLGTPAVAALAFLAGITIFHMPLNVFHGGAAAAAPKDIPNLISQPNLLGSDSVRFTMKDLVVILLTVPLMIALTLFVKYTKLGKAMRAVAQNPTAARLMGIDVDRVISATFLIGGALAGAASVIYSLYINTTHYQVGYQNGLYAFTAAVIGGIGNIPGAMLGGILIGVIRALSDQYLGAQWQPAVLFGILILILVFRPSGLLGTRTREKV